MAEEEKSMTYEYTDPETKKDYIFYSTTGEPATEKQFEGAAVHFEQPGSLRFTTPPGFTALEKGSGAQQLRGGYQSTIDFLKNMSDKIALPRVQPSTVDNLLGTNIAGTVQNLSPEAKGMADITARNVSSGTARSLVGTVDTPTELAVTASQAALGIPKGIPQAISNTSGLLSTAVRSVAAGGASYGLNKAMGTDASQSVDAPAYERAGYKALMTAGVVAATDGVVGVLSMMAGATLKSKGTEQVKADIVEAIAKRYPQVKYQGGDGVNKLAMSSKQELQAITEVGMKSVRDSAKDSSSLFIKDIDDIVPNGLRDETKNALKGIVDKYRAATDGLFDNIDDPKLVSQFMKRREELGTEIVETIVSDMKIAHSKVTGGYDKVNEVLSGAPGQVRSVSQNVPDPDFVLAGVRLQQVMDQYKQSDMEYVAVAKVMSLLKNHNPGGGYDPTKFQKLIENEFYKNLRYGPLLKDVGMAATRGAPGTVDKQHGIPFNAASKWLLDKVGLKIPPMIPTPAGTTYTGAIRGKIPYGTIATGTNAEIQKMFERKE